MKLKSSFLFNTFSEHLLCAAPTPGVGDVGLQKTVEVSQHLHSSEGTEAVNKEAKRTGKTSQIVINTVKRTKTGGHDWVTTSFWLVRENNLRHLSKDLNVKTEAVMQKKKKKLRQKSISGSANS